MSIIQRPRRFTVDSTFELKPLYPATTRLAILLVTYNHSKYVRRALESILFQDIELDYEIVIADDASTDDTREVIREFLEVNGKTNFRFLDYSRNLGITKNYQRSVYACNSEYVAILEGDDYWINTGRLRILLNHLHVHRECVGVSSNYFVSIEERAEFYPRVPVRAEWSYIDARMLIRDNVIGNFSTCMYRTKALSNLPPKMFDGESYDWIFNICLMKHGLIGFYNEPLSVYNVHLNGTWSRMTDIERIESQLGALERFDTVTGFVFKDDFDALRQRLSGQREAAVLKHEEVHDPKVKRNKEVNDAIQRSRFPFLTRVLHAIHFRMSPGTKTTLNKITPSFLKKVIVRLMVSK